MSATVQSADIRAACDLARAKSAEHPDRPVSVYLSRPCGTPGRYTSVGIRFGDTRSRWDADGRVYVLYEVWQAGAEVAC